MTLLTSILFWYIVSGISCTILFLIVMLFSEIKVSSILTSALVIVVLWPKFLYEVCKAVKSRYRNSK
jgi:hypothetical protein